MSDAFRRLTDIRMLENLADRDTFVHRRHPAANLLVTLSFILVVASFGKYELTAMVPMILYPVSVFALGAIPVRAILLRVVPALPLLIGVGLFNPLFDRQFFTMLAGIPISAGWISLLTLLFRGGLSVVAALLLVSVVGISGLSTALRTLRVPRVLVMQLEMTFRYIHVLGEEAVRMSLAYRLRAPGQKGIAFRYWGSLMGQWLLRTLHRADRVHRAMLCRGFQGNVPVARNPVFQWSDLLYLVGWLVLFLVFRWADIPVSIGSLVLGVGGG